MGHLLLRSGSRVSGFRGHGPGVALPDDRGKSYNCPLVSFPFPFFTPFVGSVKLDWAPPSVTENFMFTEVQEESAGVNQSTEGAGNLTSYQPHWVSQIWPSESLYWVTQDLMSSEMVYLFIALPGGRVGP